MQTLLRFIDNIVEFIINPLIGLLFALALAFFVWGAAQLILKSDEASERKKYQNALMWGLIGMFVMASVFGILEVVLNTFDVDLPR